MDIIFGEVELYLPKTVDAVVTARRLLDMVEDEIVSGWVCKHCGCTENTPCPGGCSWVAPNVCSRCAEENAPEIPKPETLRNISPLKESMELCGCGDELRTLEDLESKMCGVCRSLKKDVVPGKETEPGSESPAASFVFKECMPFKWFGLPTFRAGKTMYSLLQGMVHIMREGYGDVSIWATRDDLRYMYEHPEAVKTALGDLYENKKYILRGFLHDVEFSKIGCDEHRTGIKPDEIPLSKEIPQNTQNDVKCPKCGISEYSKWGTKKTSTGVKYQYYCKPCGKVFSSDLDVGRKNALPKSKEAPHAKDSEAKKPETQDPGSIPGGAISQSSSAGQAKSTSNIEPLHRSGKQEISNMDATHSKPGTHDDPDRIYKPFGLSRLTKTSGDGEGIEQEYIENDEVQQVTVA